MAWQAGNSFCWLSTGPYLTAAPDLHTGACDERKVAVAECGCSHAFGSRRARLHAQHARCADGKQRHVRLIHERPRWMPRWR
jgi:hypothetical protein